MSSIASGPAEMDQARSERVKLRRLRLSAFRAHLIPWARSKRLRAVAEEAAKMGAFAVAARLYRSLAKSGDAEAQFQLGMLYYKGRGVVLNLPEAVAWMHQAAEQNHAAAQFFLGQAYQHNIEGQIPAFDLSRWYGEAQGDNPGAQANRALLFPDGVAVPRDEEKSLYWLRRAAEGDHPLAMVALAKRLLEAEEPESVASAVAYLHRAVELSSHPATEYELARLYIRGTGVERNVEIAIKHLKIAGESGMTEAAFQLGLLYVLEPPVQDLVQAAAWFAKAAERGHITAQLNLANLYWQGKGVSQDVHKAAYWFRKAANNNNPTAQLNLGLFYERGLGVEKDMHEAASWYQRAAQRGHPIAQFNLGNLYQRGRGVARNPMEGATWYLKAALQDHAEARANLAILCANAKLGMADSTQALMWLRLARAAISPDRRNDAIERMEVDIVARMAPEQIAEAEEMVRTWAPDFDRWMAALSRLHRDPRG